MVDGHAVFVAHPTAFDAKRILVYRFQPSIPPWGSSTSLVHAPNATTPPAFVWNSPTAGTNAPSFVALNFLTQFYSSAAGSAVLTLIVVRQMSRPPYIQSC